MAWHPRICVVTPTYLRPEEAAGLLQNLSRQTLLPQELVMVDGAPETERETEKVVLPWKGRVPYTFTYLRRGGGTAIQRNHGIEAAQACDLIAFIDDDIRLEPDFFESVARAYSMDPQRAVGGIVGYRTNEHFSAAGSDRWRWFRRLHLLKTYEPGRYDFETGYPINANMQPPFQGVRAVDFMTTSCAVWRREVLDSGLRFDPFFSDYGVLEDAHFALRAGKRWKLLQCGDAHCIHDHSPRGRPNRRRIGYKCVVNYYYVFNSIVGRLSWRQKRRFWTYQAFEWFRILASGIRRMRGDDFRECLGRIEGFWAVARNQAW